MWGRRCGLGLPSYDRTKVWVTKHVRGVVGLRNRVFSGLWLFKWRETHEVVETENNVTEFAKLFEMSL